MKRRILLKMFIVAVSCVLGFSLSRAADDADFFIVEAPPNLLWILDTSGSMMTLPCNNEGSDGNQGCESSFFDSLGYNSGTTYTDADPDFAKLFLPAYVYSQGDQTSDWSQQATSINNFCNYCCWSWGCNTAGEITCKNTCITNLSTKGYHLRSGRYYFTGNFLNFYPPKYVVARSVLKNLIRSTLVRIRMGLMIFDGDNGGTLVRGINPPCPLCLSSDAAYDNNRTSIINNINNPNTVDFESYTPLSETLFNAGQYLSAAGFYAAQFGNAYVKNLGGEASDPVPYSCMANFTIIITDGIPTQDQYIPCKLRNYDGDCYEGLQPSPSCNTDWGCNAEKRSYDTNGSDYLDDVAKWLAETDLRPDAACCAGDTGCSNTCTDQSLITYTVGFAVDHPLLKDTADNGQGIYYTATNSQELEEVLQEALLDIIRRSMSFAIPSVPSARVEDYTETGKVGSEDKIYIASFMPYITKPWHGHLKAFALDSEGNILEKDKTTPAVNELTGMIKDNAIPFWDAGECLSRMCLDHPDEDECDMDSSDMNNCFVSAPDRKIYTAVDVDSDGDLDQIEFNAGNAGILFPLLAYGTTTDDAVKLINYVRGLDAFDKDGDGNVTEEREWKLGDIFHSTPVMVGQPNPIASYKGYSCAIPGADGDGFRSLETIMRRKKIVLAGANDGMLHAFDAGSSTVEVNKDGQWVEVAVGEVKKDCVETYRVKYDDGTGKELWAFIPPNLLPKLKNMISGHQYYVDGSPRTSDVWIDKSPYTEYEKDYLDPDNKEITNAKESGEWVTFLICGERQGGNQYFAMDITNTENPVFLWVFSDAKMAETWSETHIQRIQLALGSDRIERWVAMMGGGLSPTDTKTGADLEPNTGNAFFVLDIATGDKIWEFSSDSATSTFYNAAINSRMIYDIPSSPTVADYNFASNTSDDFSDWVYIGDLGGQMWKFALNGPTDDEGRFTLGKADAMESLGTISEWYGEVFFDAGGTGQPIHFRPSIGLGREGNLWIYFGTGDRNDPKKPDVFNRFYGVRDFNKPELEPFMEINLENVTGRSGDSTPAAGQGWYISLADQGEDHAGEKVLAVSTMLYGRVYFTTFSPQVVIDNPCATNAGGARLYDVEYQSGSALGNQFTGGLRYMSIGQGIPTPVVVTMTQTPTGQIEYQGIIATSSGNVITIGGLGFGRVISLLSWQEIFY